jgi:hypothetical protein
MFAGTSTTVGSAPNAPDKRVSAAPTQGSSARVGRENCQCHFVSDIDLWPINRGDAMPNLALLLAFAFLFLWTIS